MRKFRHRSFTLEYNLFTVKTFRYHLITIISLQYIHFFFNEASVSKFHYKAVRPNKHLQYLMRFSNLSFLFICLYRSKMYNNFHLHAINQCEQSIKKQIVVTSRFSLTTITMTKATASELKEQGNRLFASRNYDEAIRSYTEAIVSAKLCE